MTSKMPKLLQDLNPKSKEMMPEVDDQLRLRGTNGTNREYKFELSSLGDWAISSTQHQ